MTGPTPESYRWQMLATVTGNHDGDTCDLDVHLPFGLRLVHDAPGSPIRGIRLLGIACNELRAPGGPEAQAHLAALIPPGTLVILQTVEADRPIEADKYGGRYDAVVYVGGQSVAGLMVAAGYAVPWNGRGAQPPVPWPPAAKE